MGKRKTVRNKILDYLSKPRDGRWTNARVLAKYLKEPLEKVEFYICLLTDQGLIQGVRDETSGEFWIHNLWIRNQLKRTVEELPPPDQGPS